MRHFGISTYTATQTCEFCVRQLVTPPGGTQRSNTTSAILAEIITAGSRLFVTHFILHYNSVFSYSLRQNKNFPTVICYPTDPRPLYCG